MPISEAARPLLPAHELVRARSAPGLGVLPHARQSLGLVPEVVLERLAAAGRGVVVLAVDGLPFAAALQAWDAAELVPLTSTFPSTSVTGWLTAVTGAGVGEHLGVGSAYRDPDSDALVLAVTGERLAGGDGPLGELLRSLPTTFGRAVAAGARAVALGRELDGLGGPWPAALLRGAARLPSAPASVLRADAADPERLVASVAAGVTGALREIPGDRPLLLWVYANLDDHLHAHGCDARVRAALGELQARALGWARDGWAVLAHSDHGQARVVPDPATAAAWERVAGPEHCRLPAGGAGRVRWLYPRPGRGDEVAARLAEGLAGCALVLGAGELVARGLLPDVPALLERVGEVVALATGPGFPVADPVYAWEHGALTEEEMLVPLAAWSA